MKPMDLRVPGVLLLDHQIAASAKLLWISSRLGGTSANGGTGRHRPGSHREPGLPAGSGRPGSGAGPGTGPGAVSSPHTGGARGGRSPLSPGLLQARSGLTRHTVLRGLARLQAAGWHPSARTTPNGPSPRGWASVPSDLLLDRRLGIQAKLLYGALQLTTGFRNQAGQFTYAALIELTGLSPNTLKRAVRTLQQCGWLQTAQKNKFCPAQFTLRNPAAEQREAEVGDATRRLDRARFLGEALMREYLSVLADTDEFDDDATTGFLVNPFTGEKLQLDRYYPPGVAFEFNGAQHYERTELHANEAEFRKQRARDYLKAGICNERGIRLVVVHAEDLTLESMRQKVAGLLPLRSLDHHQPLIKYLEKVGRNYRKQAILPA